MFLAMSAHRQETQSYVYGIWYLLFFVGECPVLFGFNQYHRCFLDKPKTYRDSRNMLRINCATNLFTKYSVAII